VVFVVIALSGCGRLEFTRIPRDGAVEAGPVDGGLDAALDGAPDATTDGRVDGSPDASPVDSGADTVEPVVDASPDTSFPAGLAFIDSFVAGWSTETNIYWTWNVSIDELDFDRFEIVTGPSADAVRARGAGTRVWGPADNPELGLLVLPTADPVTHTITVDHPRGGTVFGQLWVWDTSGGVTVSEPVSTRMLSPSSEVVVFADADTAGYSLPSSFTRSTTNPYAGTHCYAFSCGSSACFENLRRQDTSVDVSALPAGAYERAFYEFALQIDGMGATTEPSYWSDVRLSFSSGSYWKHQWITFPAGGYRVIQIPLRIFEWADVALDHATVTATPLREIWVGGQWPADAIVRLDEVRIRW
jgi:hypothetical protein